MRAKPALACLTTIIFFFLSAVAVFAQTSSVTVSVRDETNPTIPLLIAPANNLSLNNSKPTFIFEKSTDPQSPIWYYQMFLNGELFFSEIAASQSPVETNAYFLTANDKQIKITLKQPIQDGIYNWKIRVFDVYSNYSDSAVWVFAIDTIAPDIMLDKINGRDNLGFKSYDYGWWNPDLVVRINEAKPEFAGVTEPRSQIQIMLVADNKHSVKITGTANDNGLFSLFPDKNLSPATYLLQLSVSDPAGNTTLLKNFRLSLEKDLMIEISTAEKVSDMLYFYSFGRLELKTKKLAVFVWYFCWLIISLLAYGLRLCYVLDYLWLLLLAVKKGKNKAVNSKTFGGVGFCLLRLYKLKFLPQSNNMSLQNIKLVQTLLADKKGYFKINTQKQNDNYLEAHAFGYEFPDSSFQKEQTNPAYYFGQKIDYSHNIIVLLKPLALKLRLRKALLIISFVCLFVALIISFYNLLYQKQPSDALVFALVFYTFIKAIC